jgi:hypothetical protein
MRGIYFFKSSPTDYASFFPHVDRPAQPVKPVGSSALPMMYLRRTEKALRLRGPLANDPTAQILHALQVGLACAILLDFALSLRLNPRQPAVAAMLVITFTLDILVSLVLLHRGSLRAASLTFLSGYWLLSTLVIIRNGGIRSAGAVYYLVPPILAAWLLGYRAALVSAGICVGKLLIMAVLELIGRPLPLYLHGTSLGIWGSARAFEETPIGGDLSVLPFLGLLASGLRS